MNLRLHCLFGDHMVLQQEQPITLCGWATPQATVSAQLHTSTGTGLAAADGRWAITLSPLTAGGPFELIVTAGSETITLRDILIGEVWVCSGQSNMEWPISGMADSVQVLAEASHSQLRLLKIPRIPHPVPPEHIEAKWQISSAESAANFSKVGYHFGVELLRKLDVPVGLIDAARGGTYVESWTPRDLLLADAEMAPIVRDYEANLPRHAELLAEHQKVAKAWAPPPDSGNTGFAQGFADPATDATKWPLMTIPCWWQYGGLWFHGSVWFRRDIDVPANWAGRDLTIHLGACDKTDISYFNNVEIGSIPIDAPDAWRAPRVYKIPGHLVRAGRNTIAVRVFCNVNQAGMTGPASAMKLVLDDAQSLPLAGLWHYRVEQNIGRIIPPIAPYGPGNFDSPSILFTSLIEPLRVFRIRGAIWYQAENNEHTPERYARIFPAMIRGWRKLWQQGDFPFLFVQLPNFGPEEPPQIFWTKLRAAQEAALAEPNTAMVPTIDIGDPNDLHPANKVEVGQRLSLAALSLAYHQADPTLLSPRFQSATIAKGKIHVALSPANGPLSIRGEKAEGFTVAGKDGIFLPAQAQIEGAEIIIWSDQISEPQAVSYAWADNPRCNVINPRGLPLTPFRWSRT